MYPVRADLMPEKSGAVVMTKESVAFVTGLAFPISAYDRSSLVLVAQSPNWGRFDAEALEHDDHEKFRTSLREVASGASESCALLCHVASEKSNVVYGFHADQKHIYISATKLANDIMFSATLDTYVAMVVALLSIPTRERSLRNTLSLVRSMADSLLCSVEESLKASDNDETYQRSVRGQLSDMSSFARHRTAEIVLHKRTHNVLAVLRHTLLFPEHLKVKLDLGSSLGLCANLDRERLKALLESCVAHIVLLSAENIEISAMMRLRKLHIEITYTGKPFMSTKSALLDVLIGYATVLGGAVSDTTVGKHQYVVVEIPLEILEHEREAIKVLCVESNPVVQKIIMQFAQQFCHKIMFASDGREAVKAIESGPFDVVFIEYQTPLMSGIEVVNIIRSRESLAAERRTPVVVLTGALDEAARKKALESGADLVQAKPLSIERYSAIVDSFTL
jgi:CheY-like chemotaxis protein